MHSVHSNKSNMSRISRKTKTSQISVQLPRCIRKLDFEKRLTRVVSFETLEMIHDDEILLLNFLDIVGNSVFLTSFFL